MASSGSDYIAYGMHYQWGRKSDVHQCITWTSSHTGTYTNGTTKIQCTGGICSNALFVMDNNDWNAPSSNVLWDGITKGINNPCPVSNRLPNQAELHVLKNSFNPDNAVGAYASSVKMPLPGYRFCDDGLFHDAAFYGYYWTSTTYLSDEAYYLPLSGESSGIISTIRSLGFSLRFIAQ